MSSTTSSSERGWFARLDLHVLLAVGASLVLGEVVIGRLQRSLSADVRHIMDAPAVIPELSRAPAPRVLFFGNSMIRRGISPDVSARLSAALGTPCGAARVFFDGSSALEWRWALERLIADQAVRPDALVLGFTPGQLGDDEPVRPQRLAWHVRVGDILPLAREESLSIDQSTHLAAARASALVRNGDRVRERWLDLIVPGYRAGSWREREPRTSLRGGERRLRRLLELLARERIAVFAVAMPTREDYVLPPAVVTTFTAGGATVIDGRRPPGLLRDATHFHDDLHLGDAGAELFTTWLVERLAPTLPR